MTSLFHDLWFLVVLFAVLIVPGWFLMRAFFETKQFTLFEWSLLSVAASLASLDFLLLGLFSIGHLHLTTLSVSLGLIAETGLWYGLGRYRHGARSQTTFLPSGFSPREYAIILVIFVLTLGVKGFALASNMIPSATDLGHHLYWSTVIAKTGNIPKYTKEDVITVNGHYQLSDPAPIADFIIGEHLPFVALRLLTDSDFFSAFPIITLLFINLCSGLALFALAWRLFLTAADTSRARSTALFALLLIGPVYALSSPQVKFVSGGVIGNTIGNLFIPLLWLVYARALQEKDSRLLTFGFFLTFGLVYTHHLSTLMFLIGLVFFCTIALLTHPKEIGTTLKSWIILGTKPAPLLFILGAAIFFFLVIAPSYADPNAIGTAVGSPTKTTRVGLPFLQFTVGTVGILRIALGLLGLFLVFFLIRRSRPSTAATAAVLAGWAGSLLVLSLRPQWAFINIPSNRVATYAIFPLTLLAGFVLATYFDRLRSRRLAPDRLRLPVWLTLGTLTVWSAILFGNGFFDNTQNFPAKDKDQAALETFAASRFVASVISPTDVVLKDHNYLVADSWIKHFFLRDYNFPLSRGYFQRYEDTTKNREQCTLWMISIPNTPKGEQCYRELGVTFVMVNPHFDRKQFEQSPEFSLVYLSDSVAVYSRHP